MPRISMSGSSGARRSRSPAWFMRSIRSPGRASRIWSALAWICSSRTVSMGGAGAWPRWRWSGAAGGPRASEAEREGRGLGHHGSVPGRIEHEFDLDPLDMGQGAQLLADFLAEDGPHAAAGGGQGHADLDQQPAFVVVGQDLAGIDQAQLHDVDGDLGVVA